MQTDKQSEADDTSFLVPHTPPHSLMRGFASLRSGEHKTEIEVRHSGEVPVRDVGWVSYQLRQTTATNTRARLNARAARGEILASGAADLRHAHDRNGNEHLYEG